MTANIISSTPPLPEGQFRVIYADPPWRFRDSANAGKRGAVHKYNLMAVDKICALPVRQIADDSCLLAMWWVSTMPKEALAVCDMWGFKFFKMDGFTWRKVSCLGVESFGMGNLTRSNVEHCLFGLRGKIKNIRQSRSVRQVINSPRLAHSEKPPQARDRLATLCGDVPRIELFARKTVPGWHAWGDQAMSKITESARHQSCIRCGKDGETRACHYNGYGQGSRSIITREEIFAMYGGGV